MPHLAIRFSELGLAGQLLVFMFGSVCPPTLSPVQYAFLPAITKGRVLSIRTIYLASILPSLGPVSRPEDCSRRLQQSLTFGMRTIREYSLPYQKSEKALL